MTTTTERRAVEVGDRFMCFVPGDPSGALTIFGAPTGDGWCNVHWDKYESPSGIVSVKMLLDPKVYARIDVPAAAPLAADRCKAPEGYVQCREACGTWHVPENFRCWECHFARYPDMRGRASVVESIQKYPDWTPPLAAQPAEMKLCGYPIGSDEDPCALNPDHLGRHSRHRAIASKPAPQPAPEKINPAPMRGCQRPGVGYVECDGPVNGGLCASHAMLSRLSVGKPARFNGLRRLAHSAMWADEAEDVR